MVLSVTEETSPTPAQEPLLRRLGDAHLGSLLGGVALLFVALKVLAVSHYETTTAFGIVAETGTASLVVGVLVQTLPLVLLAILFGLVSVADDEARPTADRRFLRWFAWIMAILAAWALPVWFALPILVMTWLLLLGPGASRLLLGFLRRVWSRGDRARLEKVEQAREARQAIDASLEESAALRAEFDRTEQALRSALDDPSKGTADEAKELLDRLRQAPDRLEAEAEARLELAERAVVLMNEVQARLQRRIHFLEAARPVWRNVERNLAISYAVIALVIGLSGQPWLPAERISVDGQPAVTGYILSTAQTETVVLVEKTREVLRLEGSTVSRRYCALQPNTSRINRPLAAMLGGVPQYPACRSLQP